jgi:hypothetical protein
MNRRALVAVGVWALAACAGSGSGMGDDNGAALALANPQCQGCQMTMDNGCLRVVGAAADRVGVTIARVCESYCCPFAHFQVNSASHASYVRPASTPMCPTFVPREGNRNGHGAIEGVVTDRGGAEQADGATIIVTSPTQTWSDLANANGGYSVPSLPSGQYTMAVYYGERVFKKQCIDVHAGTVVLLDVELEARVASEAIFLLD